jgi:NADH-ubiquinone oxidoreductase chain 4
LSTLRTTNIKEIIAYSSVCHASVYILGAFSNTLTGIEGAILLGIAHGFTSSGLFILVGGVLYEKSGSLNIFYYRGMAQLMPLFSIFFFIFTLANCGTPLTLNFVGEFLSLYGAFERLPVAGALACSSIVFSAAYSVYLFNRVAFGGSFSLYFKENLLDLNRREFFMLFVLVFFTALLGVYPSILLDVLHYSVSSLIYKSSSDLALAFLPLLILLRGDSYTVPSFNKTDAVFRSVLLPFFFGLKRSYSTRLFSADTPVLIPVKIYKNADLEKHQIIYENSGRAGIYMWKNLSTGKKYVGSSINLRRRLLGYFNVAYLRYSLTRQSKIYTSLLKYGYNSYSLYILEYCASDKVIEREQYYLDTLKPELNILPRAGSLYGYKWSYL